MNAASRVRPTVPRQTGVGRGSGVTGGSARASTQSSSFASPGSPKRAPGPRDAASRGGAPSSGRSRPSANAGFYQDEESASSQRNLSTPGMSMSRSSQNASSERALTLAEEDRGLFSVIEHLAALEAALWSILDGLKANATYVSFFCREYWGTSAGQAMLALEKLTWNERLKRQVQQACVLESLSLGVASHLCSGTMQDVSLTVLSRLRNLLYYIHENALVLMDLVCQRWLQENPDGHRESDKAGHCPENLNLDILIRTNRYRQLRKGEHVMALRQHNEMIANVVRQLCRGAALRRPPAPNRARGATSPSPGDRSPSLRGAGAGAASRPAASSKPLQGNILAAVNDVMAARTPLDRLRASVIRSRMLQYLCFRPLLNENDDPDCLWPIQDPYVRYGSEHFAADGHVIWFEPLPPMLCDLKINPKLPPVPSSETYTLVLDLDETLVHYFESDGVGSYGIRPGMREFLMRMSAANYELVIFTAATQDYADWVIDQIDPERLIHHRLYRQHALPWGPLFAKDLSRLGRDLERTLIIDNVQENFMLQPNNGILIANWYEDPHDTALFTLTPLLEELIQTRARVPEILDKYRDQIPTWAGFDQYSQLGGEFSDGYDGPDEGYMAQPPPAEQQQDVYERPVAQQDFQPPQRNDYVQPAAAPAMYAPARAEAPQYAPPPAQQPQPPQYEAASVSQPQQYVQAGYAPQAASQAQYLQPRAAVQPAASAAGPQRAQPAPAAQQALARPAPSFSKVSGSYQAQQSLPAQQQPQAVQAQQAPQAMPGVRVGGFRAGMGSHQYVPPPRQ